MYLNCSNRIIQFLKIYETYYILLSFILKSNFYSRFFIGSGFYVDQTRHLSKFFQSCVFIRTILNLNFYPDSLIIKADRIFKYTGQFGLNWTELFFRINFFEPFCKIGLDFGLQNFYTSRILVRIHWRAILYFQVPNPNIDVMKDQSQQTIRQTHSMFQKHYYLKKNVIFRVVYDFLKNVLIT